MIATGSATLVEVLLRGQRTRSDTGTSLATRAVAVLFFAALTAAAAQVSVPLPFTQVPFTFQPTIVLLSGLVLGPRLGAASQLLYLAAGIAGLPVFAASPALPPGVWRLLGPTGGYLLSYPLAAFIAGALARRGFDRRYLSSIAAMALGLVVIYACGTLWLAYASVGRTAIGLASAFATGVVPFVIADIVKLAAAAGIVPGLWRLVPPLSR
ncbi:MAG TPA: biotin transporter BioY [Vicinamibacterales bacterium]|jgi:biotin transport system substrate-specific component|nr:biotin transporter BioY [Vicinamibacterales bacterium]